MPLYNLVCRTSLSSDQQQKVAEAITTTHCDETGAPAAFVNIVFLNNYPLPKPQIVSVLGGVRTGGNRTPEGIAKLETALHKNIANALTVSTVEVGMSLIGVPSNWIVEGGQVMPEPGSEEEKLMNESH